MFGKLMDSIHKLQREFEALFLVTSIFTMVLGLQSSLGEYLRRAGLKTRSSCVISNPSECIIIALSRCTVNSHCNNSSLYHVDNTVLLSIIVELI